LADILINSKIINKTKVESKIAIKWLSVNFFIIFLIFYGELNQISFQDDIRIKAWAESLRYKMNRKNKIIKQKYFKILLKKLLPKYELSAIRNFKSEIP
jgi:hypothetical protein